MKTETKEIYKCEYCNKLYQIKRYCEYHELACKKRPDYLRPCHSCKILDKINAKALPGVSDWYGSEIERDVNVLFCKARDCFIHPPSVAAKGTAFDMMDKENIEMPKECEFYVEQDFL